MTDNIITEEIILNANTYIPVDMKSVMAREYAKNCVSEVQITIKDGDEKDVLPPRYQENPMQKSLYGMMTLLDQYLHVLVADENGEVSLTSSEYDKWGSACVMNQLDRFKSSKNIEVRNKIYDILDDYREFYRMLGVEISSILANRNDVLTRLVQYFKKDITPEMMKDLFSQFTGTLEEIKDYKDRPKEWASEDVKSDVQGVEQWVK